MTKFNNVILFNREYDIKEAFDVLKGIGYDICHSPNHYIYALDKQGNLIKDINDDSFDKAPAIYERADEFIKALEEHHHIEYRKLKQQELIDLAVNNPNLWIRHNDYWMVAKVITINLDPDNPNIYRTQSSILNDPDKRWNEEGDDAYIHVEELYDYFSYSFDCKIWHPFKVMEVSNSIEKSEESK